MTVRFHDPRARSPVPPEAYELATDLGQGLRLGLLANSFVDCDRLMAEMGTALSGLRPAISVLAYNKETTSPAPEALVDQMAAECDALVVAIAH